MVYVPPDPELLHKLAQFKSAQKGRDARFGASSLGAMADVMRGSSVADAVAARQNNADDPMSPNVRAQVKAQLVGALRDLEKASSDMYVADESTKQEIVKAQTQKVKDLRKHLFDLAKQAIITGQKGADDSLKGKVALYKSVGERLSEGLLNVDDETKQKVAEFISQFQGEPNPDALRGDIKAFSELMNGLTMDQRAAAMTELSAEMGLSGSELLDAMEADVRAIFGGEEGSSKEVTDFIEAKRSANAAWDLAEAKLGAGSETTAALRQQQAQLEVDIMKGAYGPGFDSMIAKIMAAEEKLSKGTALTPQEAAEFGAAIEATTGEALGLPTGGEASDPFASTRKSIETQLADLDKPQLPELVAQKQAILDSPEFQTYMTSRGFQDPQFAFRTLTRELQARKATARAEDRTSAKEQGLSPFPPRKAPEPKPTMGDDAGRAVPAAQGDARRRALQAKLTSEEETLPGTLPL